MATGTVSIHGPSGSAPLPSPRPRRRIALVGNPNVGKSVLFHRLTGEYAQVSNYPGTTVMLASGRARIGGREVDIVDTPGILDLVPQSEDERVTRDILVEDAPDAILIVADAKNPRRALLLIQRIAELGIPIVVALNMTDEARRRGIDVDVSRLGELFEVPVVETVATEGFGISELLSALGRGAVPKDPMAQVKKDLLREIGHPALDAPLGLLAESLLAEDNGIPPRLARLKDSLAGYEQRHGRSFAEAYRHLRSSWLESALVRIWQVRPASPHLWGERIGRWCREPSTGAPILLGVLFLTYSFVGLLGAGYAVDFLEEVVFGRYLVPGAAWLLERFLPFAFLRDLLIGPYGALSMGLTYSIAIVLPVVSTFFFAFGILEDSGYLPRLSVLANRMFRAIGLNGRAVLPMVLGLGCVTMATLSTRVLSTRKERLLATILLALAVPCAAQLGVILGMLAFISFGAVLLLFGILLAQLIVVGFVTDRLLPGKRSDFIVELPPMRLPSFGNLARKTWSRVRWFLREAVPLFVAGTLILFVLDRFRVLPLIVRAGEPITVGLLGLPAQAAEAFVMGFLRRDYGAAGLFDLARNGHMDHNQILVSLVTMTLFVPCVANFLVIVKEQNLKKAISILLFVVPYAVMVGAGLRFFLRWSGIEL